MMIAIITHVIWVREPATRSKFYECGIEHVCIEWRAKFSAGVCIRNVISLTIIIAFE